MKNSPSMELFEAHCNGGKMDDCSSATLENRNSIQQDVGFPFDELAHRYIVPRAWICLPYTPPAIIVVDIPFSCHR